MDPKEQIAAAVKQILAAVGEDLTRPDLADTPARVANTFLELTRGLREDAGQVLRDSVLCCDTATQDKPKQVGEMVLVRGVRFTSLCEHHLLPFRGIANIAYTPGDSIVGISALVKTLELFAAKPHLQERLGQEMADALVAEVGATGALVQLVASHGCMTDRGVREQNAEVVTMAVSGAFSDPVRRAEAVALLATNNLAESDA